MKRFAAAALAACLLAPVSASALTIYPDSNIEPGQTYDIHNGPFYWGAIFGQEDGPGSVWFRFANNKGAGGTTANAHGKAIEVKGQFDFIEFSWESGEEINFRHAENGRIYLPQRLLAGQDDVLRVDWGAITGDDPHIHLEVAAVPLPAGFGLLALGALGLGIAGRRKKAAA